MTFSRYVSRTNLQLREAVRGKDIPDLLYDLLQLGSPHKHEGPVRDVITHFIDRTTTGVVYKTDDVGNLIVYVGDGPHETMFSCHMDTVSSAAGRITPMVTVGDSQNEGFIFGSTKQSNVFFHEVHTNKKIPVGKLKEFSKEVADTDQFSLKRNGTSAKGNEQFDFYAVSNGKMVKRDGVLLTKVVGDPIYTASVLGADDKVGCFIMCRMIHAGVKGMYIFHVGEECGGVGSRHIATKTPELVKGVKRAIAFDRAGQRDVITYQSGGRCASDEFADALAAQINRHLPQASPQFSKCSGGVYTDTAEYTSLIPECTNLSVGYVGQHSTSEYFDYVWLGALFIPAILEVDWDSLPTKRDPSVKEGYRYGGYRYDGGYGTTMDFDNWYKEEFESSRGFPEDKWKTGQTGSSNGTGTTSSTTSTGNTNVVQLSATENGSIKQLTHQATRLALISRNTDVVPLDEVKADTPFNKLPEWIPEDGLIDGVPNIAMKKLIMAYLIRRTPTYTDMAELIFELLLENRYAIEENGNLEDELSAFRERLG